MKTRAEVLIDEINENQKLVLGLQAKIEEMKEKICIARENIKVAQANLREETR